jgi:hypothetical protein
MCGARDAGHSAFTSEEQRHDSDQREQDAYKINHGCANAQGVSDALRITPRKALPLS